MTALATSPAWQAAGWTCLHFLWLGAAIGLLAAAGRRLLRRAAPHARYVFTLGCFCALAVAPLGLFAGLLRNAPPTAVRSVGDAGNVSYLIEPGARPTPARFPAPPPRAEGAPSPRDAEPAADASLRAALVARLEALSRYLPWFWLAGTTFTAVGWMTGVVAAERLRRRCQVLVEGEAIEACRAAARALRVTRRIVVAVSDRVASPAVLGIVRPVVLLPPALLAGVDPRQLEMILLHELAHVRRWDNLVNLGQRIVESLLFYHPVVWWLSGRLRLDRELCCDGIVVAHTGQRREYARVLASFVLSDRPLPSVAAAMADRHITCRIRHILNLEEPAMSASHKAITAASAVVLAAGLFAASWADQPEAAPAPAEADANAAAESGAGSTAEPPHNINVDELVVKGAAYLTNLAQPQPGGEWAATDTAPPVRIRILSDGEGPGALTLTADGLELTLPPNVDYETLRRLTLDLQGVSLGGAITNYRALQQCQTCHQYADDASGIGNAAEDHLVLRIDDAIVRDWQKLMTAGGSRDMQYCPAAQGKFRDVLQVRDNTIARSPLGDFSLSIGPRLWGPEQAAGAPDTPEAGDYETAWASLSQDDSDEWLQLSYHQPVEAVAALIHESHNPGAVGRVVAFDQQGGEVVAWEGADPTSRDAGRGVSVIPFRQAVVTATVRIDLNSASVPGWNEIDAVGLIDAQGNTHWAASATASSTYADLTQTGGYPLYSYPESSDARIQRLEAEVQALREALEQLKAELQRRGSADGGGVSVGPGEVGPGGAGSPFDPSVQPGAPGGVVEPGLPPGGGASLPGGDAGGGGTRR